MTDPVTALCPEPWVKKLKPFLTRAEEFKAKQPVVSYHLKTFVAAEAMKLRNKDDPKPLAQAGTKFLMALMDQCEKEKAALANELRESDGRTVLTKTGLMLFSKADDLERTGNANEAIVKLFYASTQLLEATAQFTPDGKLDPIASEKVKYAKFIAFKMKKALDAGQPYVSPNELESAEGIGQMDGGAEGVAPPPPPQATSVPAPSAYSYGAPPPPPPPASSAPPPMTRQPTNTSNYGVYDSYYQTPGAQPAQSHPQAPAYQQPPPPQAQPNFPPIPPTTAQPPAPPPQPQQQQYRAPAPAPAPVSQPPAAAHPGSGREPSMDAMINSQKYAKQAVAALQFFDYNNARQQLLMALQALDQ
jgi:vacuolar protein sorting-associated protein VTA1